MVLSVKSPVHPSLSHNSPTKSQRTECLMGISIIFHVSYYPNSFSRVFFWVSSPGFHPLRMAHDLAGASPLASPHRNHAGELGFGSLSWGKVSSGVSLLPMMVDGHWNGSFLKCGYPQNLIGMDDLGVPPFQESTKSGTEGI